MNADKTNMLIRVYRRLSAANNIWAAILAPRYWL
jgi:hypothetical protein